MIGLLASQVLYLISRYFSGKEDGNVSLTEIDLARCATPEEKILDAERRRQWHKDGGIKLVLASAAFSLAYSFNFEAIFMFFMLLSSQVLIFNPVIAVKYLKQGFFYISPKGFEGYFNKVPKLYYFLNLAIYLGCLITLIILEWQSTN